MNEEILNSVYNASLEFGENFRKHIIEIIEDLYPNISSDEKNSIAAYIEQTRENIEKYFYDHYDYKNETVNKYLHEQGKQWIKETYTWMNSKNINRAASQGMYYAWHG
ncbi:hypothetical protein E4O03_10990 [Treponema sp. OMZ 792]|uniref:hypothetical protein n=1 Tax=unclassified Treponema TaxID=2638727 RepID=UPI0020A5BCE7|nr:MULTISPECIES: hypothetical protein [unclassified Treponema]UTC74712.1 hypothetical protein E4O03_10990 [Treponema sp. OMZ 792]UTC81106.1 hypothetical protein E4O07_10890 [Treponema sp. OMZ 798]